MEIADGDRGSLTHTPQSKSLLYLSLFLSLLDNHFAFILSFSLSLSISLSLFHASSSLLFLQSSFLNSLSETPEHLLTSTGSK